MLKVLPLTLALVLLASPLLAVEKTSPLQFTVKDIDGKDVDLSRYSGKVVMIVNVASRCGLTPQYKELQSLYKKYADKGFVVLGFPANEFKQQEPGSNEEIKQFCTSKFGVEFPMFSKLVVKGQGISDLYKFLTSKETNAKYAGDITWNFEKFIVGKDGKVAARFAPRIKPESDEVTKAIEAELAK